MIAHKNVNFWMRLLANSIEVILFFVINISIYLFVTNYGQNLNVTSFYFFISCSIITAALMYLLIPLVFQARTISMLICHLMYLNTSNVKTGYWKIAFKKAQFTFFYWLLIALTFVVLIMPYEIDEFAHFMKTKKTTNERLFITSKILATFSSFWLMLNLINYAFNIASKSKLSLIDRLTSTRMVYQKHYKTSKDNNIKLMPYQIKNESVIFIKKQGDGYE